MLEGQYLAKMLSRIVKSDGCWEWNGAHTTAGYGLSWNGIRPVYAHRESYEHYIGPIPEGFEIDHLCRNRGCINPDHLEAVTPRENNRRSESTSARNARKTHCKRGHPFDEENTFFLPSGARNCRTCMRANDKVQSARRALSTGISNRDKTHCKRGHPLSGENLYTYKDGRRDCRECMKIRAQRRKR